MAPLRPHEERPRGQGPTAGSPAPTSRSKRPSDGRFACSAARAERSRATAPARAASLGAPRSDRAKRAERQGSGLALATSATSPRIRERTASSSGAASRSAIQPAMARMSSSPRPRVVTAAVPMRDARGLHGRPRVERDEVLVHREVHGVEQVLASSDRPAEPTSSIRRWLSVPPLTIERPRSMRAFARALAFATTPPPVVLELRLQRLAEGHGLCRDHVHEGARPDRPGRRRS